MYSLALHSDVVHRCKMCSFTALGLTEHEASGTKSFLDQHDMALMKAVVERRKKKTVLAGSSTGLPIKVAGGRAAAAATIVAILASRNALPLGSREGREPLVVVMRPSSRPRSV